MFRSRFIKSAKRMSEWRCSRLMATVLLRGGALGDAVHMRPSSMPPIRLRGCIYLQCVSRCTIGGSTVTGTSCYKVLIVVT